MLVPKVDREFWSFCERLHGLGVTTPTFDEELRCLYSLVYSLFNVNKVGELLLDLGTLFGASAMTMAQALVDSGNDRCKVVTVDDLQDAKRLGDNERTEKVRAFVEKLGLSGLITVVIGDDIEFLKGLPDESLAILNVDSWHVYPHVRDTLGPCLPKVYPGGIICGHDYFPPHGVVRAVDEWRAANSDKLVGWGLHEKLWWTLKRSDG